MTHDRPSAATVRVAPSGRGPSRLVLGIESSCDETAASVVVDGRHVLSNVIASQHELHAEYRGVVPEIASRAHAERITPVVRQALADAGVKLPDLDAVAVSIRPGLIGSLLVGVSAAKSLAWSLRRPLVGVDHVQAHLVAGLIARAQSAYAPGGTAPPVDESAMFPALGLVVSGGHSSIFAMTSSLAIATLGGTRDDAIGEAYDKAAAILGLPYPGGPIVDRLARDGNSDAVKFPVSRLEPGSLDFSFSGLKTAMLYHVRGVPTTRGRGGTAAIELTDRTIADACASFQAAAVNAVMLKLQRALDLRTSTRCLFVGGGVSANSLLRARLESLARERNIRLVLPAMEFCLDNGAMIAALGHRILESRNWTSDPLSIGASPMSVIAHAPAESVML
jgi:N6-L-threonylcarbamoyladenine synthase